MDILHYYNRDIISQLYFELNEKMVIEINSKNSINAGSHLRAKISALFGGTEAELNGELYHEKLTKELIPDIKYVKKTIEMISAKSVNSDIFPSNKNCIYKFNGKFQLCRQFDEQEKNMYIQVSFKIGKYKLTGFTSSDNWTAKSALNLMIIKKQIEGTIIFKRLNNTTKLSQPIQIISISSWEDM